MKVNIGSKQGLEVLAETLDVSLDGFEVQSLKVNMNFGYGVFLFSHLVFFFFSFLRGAGKNNHVFDSQHDGVELEGAVRRALSFTFLVFLACTTSPTYAPLFLSSRNAEPWTQKNKVLVLQQLVFRTISASLKV